MSDSLVVELVTKTKYDLSNAVRATAYAKALSQRFNASGELVSVKGGLVVETAADGSVVATGSKLLVDDEVVFEVTDTSNNRLFLPDRIANQVEKFRSSDSSESSGGLPSSSTLKRGALSAEETEKITKLYESGMSYEDIAGELNRSEKVVKKVLSGVS